MMQFLMSRLQASAISWSSFSACRNSRGLPTETARVKAWTCSMPLSTFSMDMRNTGSSITPQNENQERAGTQAPLHPHLFRHQMLTYLTQRPDRRTDSADFRPRKQEEP